MMTMAAAMYMVVYAPKLVMTPARMIGPTMEPMRPQDGPGRCRGADGRLVKARRVQGQHHGVEVLAELVENARDDEHDQRSGRAVGDAEDRRAQTGDEEGLFTTELLRSPRAEEPRGMPPRMPMVTNPVDATTSKPFSMRIVVSHVVRP